MKRKSILARAGIVAAALTLVTTSLMSGTLAKYTSQSSTTAKAVVASWGAKFKQGDKEITESTEIKLADSAFIVAADIADVSGLVAKETESGANVYKMAPGMAATVPIVIDMSGTDVDSICSIDIKLATDAQLPKNLKFSYKVNGEAQSTPFTPTLQGMQDNIIKKRVFNITAAKGQSSAIDQQQQMKVELRWEWPIEGKAGSESAYDAQDTSDVTNTDNPVNVSLVVDMKAVQATVQDVADLTP